MRRAKKEEEIRAWKPSCGCKKAYMTKSSCRKHEKNCNWNPENKACHTCKNRSCETYENEYGKCAIWYCELKEKTIGFDTVGFGADGFDMKPVVGCENWVEKNSVGESEKK